MAHYTIKFKRMIVSQRISILNIFPFSFIIYNTVYLELYFLLKTHKKNKPKCLYFQHCLYSKLRVSSVPFRLRPHESQHTRPPCPSPTPGVRSNSTSIESVMPSSHLILCRPLFFLPPIAPSIRVFSGESTLRMRWPKYWSFLGQHIYIFRMVKM